MSAVAKWTAQAKVEHGRQGTCGRICNACGRRLDEHERASRKVLVPRHRGRGRLALVKQNVYGCRVRLIQQSPITGAVSVPESAQRSKLLDTRYVHESRFSQGGLA
jgi:hypothetical protein